MDPKQSLIAKIAGKGVVTPYEAIYLQYLNKLHVKEQTPDVERWENPYVAVEKVSNIYSQYDLKRLLTFQTIEEANQYDVYRWAANLMVILDAGAGELGFKAIALFNEVRYLQSQYVLTVSRDLRNDVKTEGTIFEFSGYSQIHQRVMTFAQAVAAFALNFNHLLVSIDDILTLNYYLRSMVKQEEYHCLKFLSILLAEEKVESEEDKGTNISHLCYQEIVDELIENNHQEFMTFMKWKVESFNVTLNESFSEGSLEYVKKSLADATSAILIR